MVVIGRMPVVQKKFDLQWARGQLQAVQGYQRIRGLLSWRTLLSLGKQRPCRLSRAQEQLELELLYHSSQLDSHIRIECHAPVVCVRCSNDTSAPAELDA